MDNKQLLEKLRLSTIAKSAAYTERNQLVAALNKQYPSHMCMHPEEDKEWESRWRTIICIHAPTGQLTWHIHDKERKLFKHLKMRPSHYDGHTTEEKYKRLKKIKPRWFKKVNK